MYQKVNDKVNIPWGEVVTASLQFQGFQVRSCDLKKYLPWCYCILTLWVLDISVEMTLSGKKRAWLWP